MYGIMIEHHVSPENREALARVWQEHMAPAIRANPHHLTYVYWFEGDDTIKALQIYDSEMSANAFLQTPEYRAYLDASAPFVSGEPRVNPFEPRWVKKLA